MELNTRCKDLIAYRTIQLDVNVNKNSLLSSCHLINKHLYSYQNFLSNIIIRKLLRNILLIHSTV